MTHDEFRRQLRTVFVRSPLVPAVIEVNGGERLIADLPEQLELGPTAVVLRRRGDPTKYRIDYEQITRVIPIDELPGDRGGLSYAAFYATLRPLLWREPFEPFSLELNNGTRLLIDRPGRLSLAGRFGVFLPPDAAPFVRFTYDQVSRISTHDTARAG